jgi:hypothetical protein
MRDPYKTADNVPGLASVRTPALDTLRARKAEARAKKRELEKLNARIERVYGPACSGIPIDIMDIPKVFDVGRKAIAEGADNIVLAAVLRAFVQSIRK